MKKEIKILSIETSCDETAAAVIGTEELKNRRTEEHPVVLSNVVSSQVDLHAKTNGVVPEVASRAHMEAMVPVVNEALTMARSKIKDQRLKLSSRDLLEGITHVAVTNGPGLIGSLLVGFNAAKTIAYARKLPFIPINHIEGHIYSAFAESNPKSEIRMSKQTEKNPNDECQIKFPILALTVSGGHTSLTLMLDHGKYQTIGETLDDAAGEAFDKVAKLLGLGYPGGPEVSRMAEVYRKKIAQLLNCSIADIDSKTIQQFNNSTIHFPRPLIDKPNFDFSFSGLKTAVLTQTIKHPVKTAKQKEEICWAFEEAAVDVLATKTIRAAKKYKPKAVILAGGVAANTRLREILSLKLKTLNLNFLPAPKNLCGDNAAMIGLAAYYHIVKGDKYDLFGSTVDANLEL